MQLLAMALILAAVLFAQYFVYHRFGMKNVRYEISISVPEAFEGDEIEVVEQIENAKWLPLPWIRTEIRCSRWLSFAGQGSVISDRTEQRGLVSSVFMLKGYQRCKRTWRVRCEKRGVFAIEDVTVTVSDLFGLVKSMGLFHVEKSVRVLPVPSELSADIASDEAFIGDVSVQRFVLPDPFVISGAKEYTGREPMNRIHWSQTARTGSLMVYNNEYTTERRVLVLMNMQRTVNDERIKLSLAALEGQIKAAAYSLDVCFKQRADVSFFANSQPAICEEAAAGYEHTIKLLRLLAELKNGCGEHIDDFLSHISLHEYTDIVYIGQFLSPAAEEKFRIMSGQGVRFVIFSNHIEQTDFCEVFTFPRGVHCSDEAGES